MITEDYVSFETAELLKEKGFNEPCYMSYHETNKDYEIEHDTGHTNQMFQEFYEKDGVMNYSAPTLQMAMKWLREVHNLFIGIEYVNIAGLGFTYQAIISKLNDDYDYCICKKSYEDAIESAIKHCLENLI